MHSKELTSKVVLIGKIDSLIKRLKKFIKFSAGMSIDTIETLGVRIFFKDITLLNLNITNFIYLINPKKERLDVLADLYFRGSDFCIISFHKKEDINYYIKLALKNNLKADQITLLKEKDLSLEVFNFISAKYALKFGLIDDIHLIAYREKLPSSFRILSDIC